MNGKIKKDIGELEMNEWVKKVCSKSVNGVVHWTSGQTKRKKFTCLLNDNSILLCFVWLPIAMLVAMVSFYPYSAK